MCSSDLSTQQIISVRLGTLVKFSAGPWLSAKPDNTAGWMTSIPESGTGTAGLSVAFTQHALSEINSAIESYISTELIPYLVRLSPGDLKALLPRYALEVRYGCRTGFRGSSFSFKFTIVLCSKSRTTDGGKLLLSIPLEDILKSLSPIPGTPSPSDGESPQVPPPGEIAND